MIPLRPAAESDVPVIREMAAAIWHASYRELLSAPQIEYMLERMYSAERILEEMRDGIHWDLVIHCGEAIGYAAYGPDSDLTRWKLHKLYLLPDFQGRGFGRETLERVCERVRLGGGSRLSLNVNKLNARAIRTYVKSDFRIVDSVVNDIGNGFVMDDFIMTRELPIPETSVMPASVACG